MKECPQCKRTYADETITFCLVDGAILSAPYEGVPPTVEAPPPTVRLPRTTKPQQVQETIPAGPPSPPLVRPPMPRSERSKSLYVAIGLAVLLLGGLVTFFVLRARPGNQSQKTDLNISTPTSERTRSETQSPEATSDKTTKPAQPASSPSPNRSPTPPAIKNPTLPTPQRVDADPALFPPDSRSSKPAPATDDKNKIFHANEVTQKAVLLSKPKPSYTEEARKNQVSGTVVLRVVLAASGEVTNITAIKGLPDGLTERAIAAARQIRFVPAMKDGHAVSQYVQLEYNFSVY